MAHSARDLRQQLHFLVVRQLLHSRKQVIERRGAYWLVELERQPYQTEQLAGAEPRLLTGEDSRTLRAKRTQALVGGHSCGDVGRKNGRFVTLPDERLESLRQTSSVLAAQVRYEE